MAATAYAALRSLLTTISMEQTPSPLHPPFPFSAQLIEALLERVRFMVDFLEKGWKKGAEHLEPRITRLAYAAEDAIEIPIVDQIRSRNAISCREEEGSSSCCNEESGSIPMGQDLESIIQDLDFIKEEMMLLIKDKSTGIIQDVHSGGSRSSTTSSTAIPQLGKTKMVGFEEDKSKIIAELTRYDHQPGLQIIPIVGMGGIGKTTLARNVFDDNHIMNHFDVRAWVTVSQEYNVHDILAGILYTIPNQRSSQISKDQVHKSLFNRRYLVVFDDMWYIDIWDEIKQYFPDNNIGSRIIVTTRRTNLAEELSTGFRLGIKCLDETNSWNLFCEKVFVEKICPLELQEVGKEIVQNCKGLPLAIAVIGGLLVKSNMTVKYWEHVVEDFHSYLYSSDGDDHCAKILFLSYNHLPVHLKPCLLYLGVFPEDNRILVSELMGLWIAEGFLKPLGGKTLEEIAEEYLKDLIERNFIMVSSYSLEGKVQNIIIHDLLRELCLRKAQKEEFYCVLMKKGFDVPLSMDYPRRIVIREFGENTTQYPCASLRSMSRVRSLILTKPCIYAVPWSIIFSSFMLLRIFFSLDEIAISRTHRSCMPSLVNMRYLAMVSTEDNALRGICTAYSSIGLLRNFQTVENTSGADETPIQIWNLVQLHRVKLEGFTLPEPPCSVVDQHNYVVLENLLSLGTLEDFRFSEEAIKRIPNVKTLEVVYYKKACEEWSHDNLNNLERLQKLESFSCLCFFCKPILNLAFPPSLKKLSLHHGVLRREDMAVIGSLPHLEVLELIYNWVVGPEWNPVQGDFRNLKFFMWCSREDTMNWTHFPCLEELHLECSNLEEIPLEIGEISTLRLIRMLKCPVSAMKSAIKILKDQQSFGEEDLVVDVLTEYKHRSIHDVKIQNFDATSRNLLWAEDLPLNQ